MFKRLSPKEPIAIDGNVNIKNVDDKNTNIKKIIYYLFLNTLKNFKIPLKSLKHFIEQKYLVLNVFL